MKPDESSAALSALLERSRRDLEWPALLDAIASGAASETAAARIRRLAPFASRSEADERHRLFGELLALLAVDARLPIRSVASVTGAIERARRHGVLSGPELADVRRVLSVAFDLARFGDAHATAAPRLRARLTVSRELVPLFALLDRALDDEGQLLDHASAALGGLRAEVRRLHRAVQKRIGELVHRFKDHLQDQYWTEHDGRYVLPVRSDAPHRMDGIVLGSSASGATLYVEPVEMAGLGNQLRVAEAEVEREEARILAELSQALGPLADEARAAEELVLEADVLGAVVRLSERAGLVAIELDPEPVLLLEQARHPLLVLAGIDVVPNDLRIEAGAGLVISGPNAGGKTVALKCLGLTALLAATGLPVPAGDRSRIGFFPLVLSDIGDDQSLAASLSTFSGHVERVRDMLTEAAPEALVLLDELMGGTDPNEGAALAIATLDEFVRRKAAIVVTTHYEALKAHAAKTPGIDNAASGFDFQRMSPTFRIDLGRPGASSALAVALRHGLPRRVTERAEQLLPEVDRRERESAEAIEQLRADLEVEKKVLAAETKKAEALTRRVQLELEEAKAARKAQLSTESDELRGAVRRARQELKLLMERMKTPGDSEELREFERALGRVAETVTLGSDVDRALRVPLADKAPATRDSKAPRFGPGDRVRIVGLKADAEVLEVLPDGRLRVVAGSLKLSASPDELEAVGGPKVKPAAQKRPAQKAPENQAFAYAPPRTEDVLLDLRGQRVEAGLGQVDEFLDRLLRRHEEGGWVLHGHGTGAMKDAVRTHLRGHPLVRESRPAERDEGGDAFTVFWLAGPR